MIKWKYKSFQESGLVKIGTEENALERGLPENSLTYLSMFQKKHGRSHGKDKYKNIQIKSNY